MLNNKGKRTLKHQLGWAAWILCKCSCTVLQRTRERAAPSRAPAALVLLLRFTFWLRKLSKLSLSTLGTFCKLCPRVLFPLLLLLSSLPSAPLVWGGPFALAGTFRSLATWDAACAEAAPALHGLHRYITSPEWDCLCPYSAGCWATAGLLPAAEKKPGNSLPCPFSAPSLAHGWWRGEVGDECGGGCWWLECEAVERSAEQGWVERGRCLWWGSNWCAWSKRESGAGKEQKKVDSCWETCSPLLTENSCESYWQTVLFLFQIFFSSTWKKTACHCGCLLWYYRGWRSVLRLLWSQTIECSIFFFPGFLVVFRKMHNTTFSKRMSELRSQLLRKK